MCSHRLFRMDPGIEPGVLSGYEWAPRLNRDEKDMRLPAPWPSPATARESLTDGVAELGAAEAARSPPSAMAEEEPFDSLSSTPSRLAVGEVEAISMSRPAEALRRPWIVGMEKVAGVAALSSSPTAAGPLFRPWSPVVVVVADGVAGLLLLLAARSSKDCEVVLAPKPGGGGDPAALSMPSALSAASVVEDRISPLGGLGQGKDAERHLHASVDVKLCRDAAETKPDVVKRKAMVTPVAYFIPRPVR